MHRQEVLRCRKKRVAGSCMAWKREPPTECAVSSRGRGAEGEDLQSLGEPEPAEESAALCANDQRLKKLVGTP
jgi:hypothetical protein